MREESGGVGGGVEAVQLRSMASNGSGPREGRAAAMYGARAVRLDRQPGVQCWRCSGAAVQRGGGQQATSPGEQARRRQSRSGCEGCVGVEGRESRAEEQRSAGAELWFQDGRRAHG